MCTQNDVFYDHQSGEIGRKCCYYLSTVLDTEHVFTQLYKQFTSSPHKMTKVTFLSSHVGSDKLKKVCMCVLYCMCVCGCLCVCLCVMCYVYLCVSASVCLSVCLPTSVCMCTYVYMYVCMYVHTCVVCVCVHVCVRACVYTYVHTHVIHVITDDVGYSFINWSQSSDTS